MSLRHTSTLKRYTITYARISISARTATSNEPNSELPEFPRFIPRMALQVIRVAKESGADCAHPGYGFLAGAPLPHLDLMIDRSNKIDCHTDSHVTME